MIPKNFDYKYFILKFNVNNLLFLAFICCLLFRCNSGTTTESNTTADDSDNIKAIREISNRKAIEGDSLRKAHIRLNQIGASQIDGYVVSSGGDSISIQEWKGRLTVLYFWATWCSPCLEKIPVLYEKMKKYGNEVNFLLLSIDEDFSDWKRYITEKNWIENSYWIGAESLKNPILAYTYYEFEDNPIIGLPRCILINKEGLIAYNTIPMIEIERIDSLIVEKKKY